MTFVTHTRALTTQRRRLAKRQVLRRWLVRRIPSREQVFANGISGALGTKDVLAPSSPCCSDVPVKLRRGRTLSVSDMSEDNSHGKFKPLLTSFSADLRALH
jgi:hypothetical protein